jgi:REP element-mobilizing transposase RayT
VSAWLRVIEKPVIRLVSVDLMASAEIDSLGEVFDFAKDYLGLLKAAVIASGVVPPGIEGSGQSLGDLLAQMLGPGRGIELVSSVNDIPKGSRLAVSTNLLAALIAVLMRATGQAESLTGPLRESERRLVLARALLGEWIGGSGGGWQDSGGVWPGIKLIEGVPACETDPEFCISRGRLMPKHHVFSRDEIPDSARKALQDSLVVVHGGMAQNVGPILEMVTEKYLLRSAAEWIGRKEALGFLDAIIDALRVGDIRKVGQLTTENFRGPIQTIIPWATNFYTERLIEQVRGEFGEDFWGFWMLGGMSGGGMGFIVAPHRKSELQERLQIIMSATKKALSDSLPFAMEPVVYDFKINENGTFADILSSDAALMPKGYYLLLAPQLLRRDLKDLPPATRTELDRFASACRTKPELRGVVQELFDALLPRTKGGKAGDQSLDELLLENGFDPEAHGIIRADMRAGRIGLAQNRLAANTVIEDVKLGDVSESECGTSALARARVPDAPSGTSEAPQRPIFKPFDSKETYSVSWRVLPHWRQAGATYFVTFRLNDSIPAEVYRKIAADREERLGKLAPNASKQLRDDVLALFSAEMEDSLDSCLGSCVLKEVATAEILERTLLHGHQKDYWLHDYVIMPNHVHVLVTAGASSLNEAIGAWKSVSAHEINKHLGRKGTLWQEEAFEHIVRDADYLRGYHNYIADNPRRARLEDGAYRLCQSAGRGVRDTITSGGARATGLASLAAGEVAVVTLSAGAASRWTQGAGVVKSLHPFCKLAGKHRTFLELHLAKSRKISREAGTPVPHIFTTSYLTHGPLSAFLANAGNYGYEGPVVFSKGKSVGLRLIPTARDLRFAWEEMPQQTLDEQQQKVRDSLRTALIRWAETTGEATDYRDNLPLQCLHPVGHFYELPNMLRNGTLAALLRERPQLKTLMMHNIDTTGANLDPTILGQHLESGATLSFEVITRRLDDRGGGLARVDGRPRLVEGLAMPREELEFDLTYYNTMTTWIDIDGFLRALGLTRDDVLAGDDDKITAAIRALAAKVPTYITLKDVKKRWGHGQEDVFPVAQFEKLWSDLTALPEIDSRFIVVPRQRGQQLKEQAQLDGWLRDGSARFVEDLCLFQ